VSLEQADSIDLVSVNAAGDVVTLHIVATEPWDVAGDGALRLQAKLKNYLAFAAEGKLEHTYPDVKGKRVRIEIRCSHPPGEIEDRLVAAVREHWCEPGGIVLEVLHEGRR
jgi:hypothetical protein